jgi:hypothetical protein
VDPRQRAAEFVDVFGRAAVDAAPPALLMEFGPIALARRES